MRLSHPLRWYEAAVASFGGRERVLRELAGILRGDDRPRASPAALGHPRRLGGLEGGHPGELSRVRPPALPTSRGKLRNIAAKLPEEARDEVLSRVKTVYHASDRETAELLAERLIEEYAEQYPSAIRCFLDDLDSCLTHLHYPLAHRRYIRSTNLLKRAFVEERRRTKVMPGHMHEKGAMKLVFGVLVRASRKWNRVGMSSFELAQLRRLRQMMASQATDTETISFKLAA